jgi:small-conductance mechanosensitive channel
MMEDTPILNKIKLLREEISNTKDPIRLELLKSNLEALVSIHTNEMKNAPVTAFDGIFSGFSLFFLFVGLFCYWRSFDMAGNIFVLLFLISLFFGALVVREVRKNVEQKHQTKKIIPGIND